MMRIPSLRLMLIRFADEQFFRLAKWSFDTYLTLHRLRQNWSYKHV